MKSVQKQRGTKAVYFDDDGKILEIAANDSRSENHAWFLVADLMPLLTAKENTNDYRVLKDGIFYSLNRVNLQQLESYQLDTRISQIENNDDPDIRIVVDNDDIKVSISENIEAPSDNHEDNITIDGQTSHHFFITLKDNPNFIIDTFEIPYYQLFCDKQVTIANLYNTDISIYSQKHFDRYSLEII